MNALLCLTAVIIAQPAQPVLRFEPAKDGTVVVAGLPASLMMELAEAKLSQARCEKTLTIGLVSDDGKSVGPTMLGKYERKVNDLIFTPRFPLVAGQTYRAAVTLPFPPRKGAPPEKTHTVDYKVP